MNSVRVIPIHYLACRSSVRAVCSIQSFVSFPCWTESLFFFHIFFSLDSPIVYDSFKIIFHVNDIFGNVKRNAKYYYDIIYQIYIKRNYSHISIDFRAIFKNSDIEDRILLLFQALAGVRQCAQQSWNSHDRRSSGVSLFSGYQRSTWTRECSL